MAVTISGSGPVTGLTSIASPTTLNGLTIPTLGFGKVLQVVANSTTSGITVASTTFTDTGLSCSITPSSNQSKVLVLISQQVYVARSADRLGAGLRVLRGSTEIFTDNSYGRDSAFLNVGGASSVSMMTRVPIFVLDEPATTGSITYKTQGNVENTANGGTSTYQFDSARSLMVLVEVAA